MLQSSYIAELEIDNNWRIRKKSLVVAEKVSREKKSNFVVGMQNMNVGLYALTPILVGVFIGYSIDAKFKTKPIYLLIGVVLGAISAFYNLWKLTHEA